MSTGTASRWSMQYLCLGCKKWFDGAPPISVQHALSYCSQPCRENHEALVAESKRRWVRMRAIRRIAFGLFVVTWSFVIAAAAGLSIALIARVLW